LKPPLLCCTDDPVCVCVMVCVCVCVLKQLWRLRERGTNGDTHIPPHTHTLEQHACTHTLSLSHTHRRRDSQKVQKARYARSDKNSITVTAGVLCRTTRPFRPFSVLRRTLVYSSSATPETLSLPCIMHHACHVCIDITCYIISLDQPLVFAHQMYVCICVCVCLCLSLFLNVFILCTV
jgi:hypothetical protein